MKVLFLDIDGVLNNDTTKERIKVKGYYGLCGIDAVLRDRFLAWMNSKGIHAPRIVLSSMWRYHPEMMEVLQANSITWDSCTDQSAAVWSHQVTRGHEIEWWLDAHPEVTNYAILDDNDWFNLEEQQERFVKTDPAVGLQDSDLAKLDRILYSDE